MQPVPGEADAKSAPYEPVREGMLGEIRQQPAGGHPAHAMDPFPAGVPSQRCRTEQPEYLNGVTLGDGEGEPGRDTFRGRHMFSFIPVTDSMYTKGRPSLAYDIPSSGRE